VAPVSLLIRYLDRLGMPYHRSEASVPDVRIVVAIADDEPVMFVIRARDELDLGAARLAIRAQTLWLATEPEISRHLPGVRPSAVPPLRVWPHVQLYMDVGLEVDAGLQQAARLVFRSGPGECVEMSFDDWRQAAAPRLVAHVC
jgi:prolyl-tRNA editing enzyme YbaK/EbsC (Cys-tRNA(Pro) deacylase)